MTPRGPDRPPASGGRARRRREGGQALSEYLAVVAVIVALFLVLTVTRAHRPGRLPVNPATRIGVLVAPPPLPAVALPRPARPRRVRNTPRRRHHRPAMRVPRWMVSP